MKGTKKAGRSQAVQRRTPASFFFPLSAIQSVSCVQGVCLSATAQPSLSYQDKHTPCCQLDYLGRQKDDFFKKDVNKNNCDYILSFWVKLESEQTSNVKAKLFLNYRTRATTYNDYGNAAYSFYDDVFVAGSSLLDISASRGWQYVTIPFFTKERTDSLTHGTVSCASTHSTYKNISHIEFEGAVGKITVADVHITPGQVPVLRITSSDAKNYVNLNELVAVQYTTNNGTVKKDISADFFMAESDVSLTALEMCRAKNTGKSSFSLICNGGTTKIAGVSNLNFSDGIKEIQLDFEEEQDQYRNNTALYRPLYEMATEPSTGDNRNYVYTAYAFERGSSIMRYTRQRTYAIQHPDGAWINTESNEYTWQDRFGRTIKKRDAYGVTTDCEYDKYGNLTKTVVSADAVEERIETINNYDDLETLSSTQDGVSGNTPSAIYTTNPLYGILEATRQSKTDKLSANTQEYQYNSFKDKLQKVQLKVNGVLYGANTLTYDYNGRLIRVAPSENCEYGFEYNAFGKAVSFSLNGVSLLTKEYDSKKNTVTAIYHRSENEQDKIMNKYDKYGKLKRISSNEANLLALTYQNEVSEEEFNESPSCANIKTMVDSAAGKTYTYDYDEYTGRPTRYTVKEQVNGKERTFQVYSSGQNKVKYDFESWELDFEDEIIYDDKQLLSPRVTKFTNNNDSYGMAFTFKYDELGRYIGRKAVGAHPESTINYKPGTLLKEKIVYGLGYYSSNCETVEQKYDTRGNILSIKNSRGETEYFYDDVNRLIKEINGEGNFTREYEYDTEGNIVSVAEGSEKEEYEYEAGRLMRVTNRGKMVEEYAYDIFGNPTRFKSASQNMWWTRGTFLKKYGDISYTYDAQGKLVKKILNDKTDESFYDGDKLIVKIIGGTQLRFFYDLEGVAGFKVGISERYTYLKDGQGNVIGLYGASGVVARYIYDAWGQCKVVDNNGKEITSSGHAALLNPFRWKSQYYDNDTGLYWMNGRWYDPERGRYISSGDPEALLSNASIVFALNMYAFVVGNPVAIILAMGSIYPSLDFFYNGEYKTWWEKWGNWVLFGIGVAATIIACIAAPFTCGASTALAAIGTTLAQIALGTAIGAAISLAIGGAIAGIQSALTGHGFWQGFADSVTENFVDAVVTSFAFTAVSIAASNIVKCFQCFKEGTLVETEEGLKPIEEIEVGDRVLACDEETGTQAYKPVLRLFRNKSTEWTGVTVNGTEIVSTPGHKYYLSETKTWVAAAKLKVGEKVLLSDGTYGIIEAVRDIHYDTPQTTYNFEVADFHTYYVGDGILVHNDGCYKGITPDGEDYYGRTNNFDRRASEHYKSGRLKEGSLTPLTDQSLTTEHAKLLEQMLIDDAGGVKNLGNKINGIASSNPLHKQIAPQRALLKSFLNK